MNKLKKGDTVQLLLGKDRGKTGSIEKLLTKNGKVVVSGVNTVKRHVKRYQGMEGGIIDISKPLDISNVALVCPSCKKVTRVGFEMKNDKKLRVCRKCKEQI